MLPHLAALQELAELWQRCAAQEAEILSLKACAQTSVPKVWVDYAAKAKPAVLDATQVCRKKRYHAQ